MGSTVQKIEPLEPFLSLFRPLLRSAEGFSLTFDYKRTSTSSYASYGYLNFPQKDPMKVFFSITNVAYYQVSQQVLDKFSKKIAKCGEKRKNT